MSGMMLNQQKSMLIAALQNGHDAKRFVLRDVEVVHTDVAAFERWGCLQMRWRSLSEWRIA